MPKERVFFLRRTYKIFASLMLTAAFFFFYNFYLVDRSLINLRAALNKAAEAQTIEDFEKIKPLIKIPVLNEISDKITSSRSVMNAELLENILTSPRHMEQIEDVKLCLKNMIQEREKQRGGIVGVLNNINSRIIPSIVGTNIKRLNIRIMRLSSKISKATDKGTLQEAYYDLANTYAQASEKAKAENAFLMAIKIDPASEIALKSRFNLGWFYKDFGEYNKAAAVFDSLINDFPESELAISSKYQIADILYKKGDFPGARDMYGRISAEYPRYENSDMGFFQAGYISLYDMDDKDKAMEYFAKLKAMYPKSVFCKHADTHIRDIIAHGFRSRGFELLKKHRYMDALAEFRKAVDFMPTDAGSLGGMGLALYWVNDREEALNKATKASELSSRDETAYANSLYVYIKMGLVDEAIRKGELTLSRHRIRIPEFYYNLGCAYLKKKKVADAINMFKIAVKKNPSSVFSLNNLGCGLWLTSRYPEAIDMFRDALDLDRAYAHAHFNLGMAYFYIREFEDAYREFREFLALVKKDDKAEEYIRIIEETLHYKPEA